VISQQLKDSVGHNGVDEWRTGEMRYQSFVARRPETLTSGFMTGAEPNAHQFYVTIVLMGDQMGRDSGRYRSNSGTESGM
jgi:hypothetical protein